MDDLQEIPISVLSSSTVLRPGDYLIFFYGEGPHNGHLTIVRINSSMKNIFTPGL
ncbi:MAG: hypothetical protein R2728_07570 [Chitinophagales bacterium]